MELYTLILLEIIGWEDVAKKYGTIYRTNAIREFLISNNPVGARYNGC